MPLPEQIAIFLEASGPSACGVIARQLGADRETVDDVLSMDGQFALDERGFWDIKAKIEARKELAMRPINQVH